MSRAPAEAVEVIAMLGTTVVSTTYVPVNGAYRIGTAAGVDLPLASAPHSSFPLVATRADGRWVVHRFAGMAGKSSTFELSSLGAPSAAVAGAHEIVLVPDGRISVQVGPLTFRVTRVAAPQSGVPNRQLDLRALPYIGGSLVAHLLVWQLAVTNAPDADPAAHRMVTRPRLIHVPKLAVSPPAGVGAPRDPTPSSTDVAPRVPAAVPRPVRRGAARRETRERAIESARSAGLLGSTATLAPDGLKAITGRVELPAALPEVHPVYREAEATAGTFGNSGHQFDPMANCTNCGILATAPYQTVSHGRTAGELYSPLTESPDTTVAMCSGLTSCVARGGIEIAEVHRHLEPRRAAILGCYDRNLLADPTLHGELVMQLQIGVDGKVRNAYGRGLGSVATCVANVVRTTPFPRAAHSTQVTYPLVFFRKS